jgi:DNA-binding MltR family transcriptional regulator
MEEPDGHSRLPPPELPSDVLKLAERTEAGTVLLVAALLEDWLQILLLSAGREISQNGARNLFENYGPLRTFSAKIEVAYLFRLLNNEVYNDLKATKDIRNCFAHSTERVFFSSPEVGRLCQRLTGWRDGNDNGALFLERAQKCLDQTKGEIEKLIFDAATRDFPDVHAS